MAEHFDPKSFTNHVNKTITIHGDLDLSSYSLNSVVFDQDGQSTPISWSSSDFHVDMGNKKNATLKSTPSAHFGDKFDPASGTLTITLSGGGKDKDSDLPISELVTVDP
jgi:hypothetical protein